MMVMICDRCGARIDDAESRFDAELPMPVPELPRNVLRSARGVDLCPACASQMMDWFARRPPDQEVKTDG